MSRTARHLRTSRTPRRALAAASAAAAGAMLAGPAVASAAPALPGADALAGVPGAPSLPGMPAASALPGTDALPASGGSDLVPDSGRLESMGRDSAWELRQRAQARVDALPEPARPAARAAIDESVERVFPGLIAARTAPAAGPAPASAPAAFDPAPCPRSARACVDMDAGRTWLQHDGEVEYGPVAASGGDATPRGTFTVLRKVRHEISHEFGDAPMPYTVYFTDTGIGFHQGAVGVPSAGCIHLEGPDAAAFFERLQVGDEVFIF